MIRYRKDEDMPTFEEIESPYKDMTFEEQTGQEFDCKVCYELRDSGNEYVERVPLESDHEGA